MRDDGYIIEMIAVGNAIKVSAVDIRTGTEVSIQAPRGHHTQEAMQELAIKKLKYVLRKKAKDAEDGSVIV